MAGLMISTSGVRGVVGDTFTPEVALGMAAAFAEVAPPGPIVVASDGRTSGEVLRSACLVGLAAMGRAAIDLGVATTPTTAIAVPARNAAGAIIVSASHNPAEWNGLKFLGPDGTFIRQQTLDQLIVRWERGDFRWRAWDQIEAVTRWSEGARVHVDRVLALDVMDVGLCRRARIPVVLDTIFASGGTVAPRLLTELGCDVVQVNGEVTGRFTRMPEPVPENIASLGEVVRSSGAAVGLVLDPDADRLALIDENGAAIGEEYTLALAVYAIRRKKRGGPVVANLSTSRMLDDLAQMLSFPVYRTPVGEINVVEGMLARDADLGGEGNGGVIYRDLHLGRDGILGIALIVQLLAEERTPLSELLRVLPRYVIMKQKVSVPPDRRKEALGHVESLAKQLGAETDTCDGVKLILPDRWLHVRPSNTEPVLRIITEAPTEADALALCEQAHEAMSCG